MGGKKKRELSPWIQAATEYYDTVNGKMSYKEMLASDEFRQFYNTKVGGDLVEGNEVDASAVKSNASNVENGASNLENGTSAVNPVNEHVNEPVNEPVVEPDVVSGEIPVGPLGGKKKAKKASKKSAKKSAKKARKSKKRTV
jgi:hypothetical protein